MGTQWSRAAWLCSVFFFFIIVLSPRMKPRETLSPPLGIFNVYYLNKFNIFECVSLRNKILPKKEGGAHPKLPAPIHPFLPLLGHRKRWNRYSYVVTTHICVYISAEQLAVACRSPYSARPPANGPDHTYLILCYFCGKYILCNSYLRHKNRIRQNIAWFPKNQAGHSLLPYYLFLL